MDLSELESLSIDKLLYLAVEAGLIDDYTFKNGSAEVKAGTVVIEFSAQKARNVLRSMLRMHFGGVE